MSTPDRAFAQPSVNPPVRVQQQSANLLVPVGEATAKSLFPQSDCIAVLGSLVCLALAICIVAPPLHLAWQIGLSRQLALIGFLISVMGFILFRITRVTLFVLEARYGSSTLQTYSAILSQSVLESKASWYVRIALFILMAIPLGLGAGYKQFIDGEDTRVIPAGDLPSNRTYGLCPPISSSAALFNSFGNSPYLLTNATFDFLQKSAIDDTFSDVSAAFEKGDSIPYGHNLLLLSNDSAAALDLPHPAYLEEIKGKLGVGESWVVKNDVLALVTRLNSTIENLRKVDDFWDEAINLSNANNFNGLTSFEHFAGGISLGMVPYIPNSGNSLSCLLGFYNSSRTFWSAYYTNSNDSEILAFRRSTLLFTTHRAKCHGEWRITKDSLDLLQGNCSTAPSNILESAIFNPSHAGLFTPFPLDALPILVHSLQDFADVRLESPWRVPSYLLNVVASYWARGVFVEAGFIEKNIKDVLQDTVYPPATSETVLSTRSALRPNFWLYFLLIVQPFITLIALILNALMYSTPISGNFGLISVLSGIDTDNLPLLHGAALSGSLTHKTKLRISTEGNRLKYTLSADENEKIISNLQRNTVYR